MSKIKSLSYYLAIVVLISAIVFGCSSGPSITDLTPEARAKISNMKVYRSAADLPKESYKVISPVEGLSCKRDAYSPSSANSPEALSNLKIKAAQQEADAVANVVCQQKSGADWKNNCWSTVVCAGDAIAITKPELIPNVAQGQQPNEPETKGVSSGTGWVVSPGFVVTNYHLVEGRSNFTLVEGNTRISATLVSKDRRNDLALLKPAEPSELPPAIPLSGQPAETGSEVFTVGYPNPSIMGSNAKVTDGIISARTGLQDDPRVYQTTVALQSGNSGGPLLNSRGEVVGITTSVLNAAKIFQLTGNLPQNVNYAVKTAYLEALLSATDSPASKVDNIEVSEDLPLQSLVERVGPSVMIVIAE